MGITTTSKQQKHIEEIEKLIGINCKVICIGATLQPYAYSIIISSNAKYYPIADLNKNYSIDFIGNCGNDNMELIVSRKR